jgi:creatinine amidohydrolase
LEQANSQSGEDQQRLTGMRDLYTAIWWYARYPNHYGGDAAPASRELGELVIQQSVDQLTAAIRAVKADTKVIELQNQFFDGAEKPIKTKQ